MINQYRAVALSILYHIYTGITDTVTSYQDARRGYRPTKPETSSIPATRLGGRAQGSTSNSQAGRRGPSFVGEIPSSHGLHCCGLVFNPRLLVAVRSWLTLILRNKAMIFLQSNAYMKRPVKPEDIKPRLLGTYAETGSPPSANNIKNKILFR